MESINKEDGQTKRGESRLNRSLVKSARTIQMLNRAKSSISMPKESDLSRK